MMPFFFFWLFHISWKEEDDFPGRYARCAGVLTGMLNTWAILTLSSYNIIPLVGGWVEAGQDHAQLLQSSDTSRWSVSISAPFPFLPFLASRWAGQWLSSIFSVWVGCVAISLPFLKHRGKSLSRSRIALFSHLFFLCFPRFPWILASIKKCNISLQTGGGKRVPVTEACALDSVCPLLLWMYHWHPSRSYSSFFPCCDFWDDVFMITQELKFFQFLL